MNSFILMRYVIKIYIFFAKITYQVIVRKSLQLIHDIFKISISSYSNLIKTFFTKVNNISRNEN